MQSECMYLYEDGRRCRARSMLNEYRRFRHRESYMPPVIENEPFDISSLDDRAAIRKALSQLAARLACNRIDLKRAGLLAYTLQTASTNLIDLPTEIPPPPPRNSPAFRTTPFPTPIRTPHPSKNVRTRPCR